MLITGYIVSAVGLCFHCYLWFFFLLLFSEKKFQLDFDRSQFMMKWRKTWKILDSRSKSICENEWNFFYWSNKRKNQMISEWMVTNDDGIVC